MKSIFIFFVVFILHFSSFAQSGWVQPGAKWCYGIEKRENNKYKIFLYLYHYDRDTAIANKTFQIVKGISISKFFDSNVIDSLFLSPYYFYTSNDSVFILRTSGNLQFLWHNNPQVNDVWRYGIQANSDSSIIKETYSKVESVDFDSYRNKQGNDIVYKRLTSFSSKDSLGTPTSNPSLDTNYLVPGFISRISTLLGPEIGFDLIDEYLEVVFPYFDTFETAAYIKHYESDSASPIDFPPYIYDCDFSTSIKQHESLKDIQLYPNPYSRLRNDVLQLLTPYNNSILNCSLFDMQGKLLMQQQLSAFTGKAAFTLASHILPGMYALRISNGSHTKTLKLMVTD